MPGVYLGAWCYLHAIQHLQNLKNSRERERERQRESDGERETERE